MSECAVYGCFPDTEAALSWDRDHVAQNLKYLLSVFSQQMFSDPWFRILHHHTSRHDLEQDLYPAASVYSFASDEFELSFPVCDFPADLI